MNPSQTRVSGANRDVRSAAYNARRTLENVERTAGEIVAAGGQAFGMRVDVASPEDNDAMVRETVARYGFLLPNVSSAAN
ncbi:hypothetical protein ACIBLB_27685 [Streptosporangium canum]|uniref:hypothetical protein n=1 Tax=Streptosporangium canum TaxID=324952 RepID=UPI003798ABB9